MNAFASRGQPPLFTCKAHVFQVDPDTRKSWIPLSHGAGRNQIKDEDFSSISFSSRCANLSRFREKCLSHRLRGGGERSNQYSAHSSYRCYEDIAEVLSMDRHESESRLWSRIRQWKWFNTSRSEEKQIPCYSLLSIFNLVDEQILWNQRHPSSSIEIWGLSKSQYRLSGDISSRESVARTMPRNHFFSFLRTVDSYQRTGVFLPNATRKYAPESGVLSQVNSFFDASKSVSSWGSV